MIMKSTSRKAVSSLKHCVTNMSPRIAVIYTHFPHYRAPVFSALSKSSAYVYDFYYDPRGIEKTIASGERADNHHAMLVHQWNGLMWQGSAIRLALLGRADAFVFLGNPLILSTWLASALARLRGRPVFFWTHGWLKRDSGTRGLIRRFFYRLADGLMVYGVRARELGRAEGFDVERIHVIRNSLDYAAQTEARAAALEIPDDLSVDIPAKPFFLTVSRLIPSVELELAVDAMVLLPKDAVLVVVGTGPSLDVLQARAQRLNVDVRFIGAIYDEMKLARLFLKACAVVSPGKIGLLAMHALAYGAPVITHSDLDRQMPEVEAIEDGKTGAFFQYGNVADLAQKMAEFLDRDAATRIEGRAAAIARIEDCYTPEAQVQLITAAIDSKLKRTT